VQHAHGLTGQETQLAEPAQMVLVQPRAVWKQTRVTMAGTPSGKSQSRVGMALARVEKI